MKNRFKIFAVLIALIISAGVFAFAGCGDEKYTALVFKTHLKDQANEISLQDTVKRLEKLFEEKGYDGVTVSNHQSLITLMVPEASDVNGIIAFMQQPVCVSFILEDSEELTLTDDFKSASVSTTSGENVVILTISHSGVDKLIRSAGGAIDIVVTNGGLSQTVVSALSTGIGTNLTLTLSGDYTFAEAKNIADQITNNILGYTFELISQTEVVVSR